MLTRKQHELLMFISRRLQEAGVPPSFDEMKEALGLRSKSGIHRLITGLEERGFIRRLPHRARALEIIRMPSNAGDGALAGTPGPVPASKTAVLAEQLPSNVIRHDFRSYEPEPDSTPSPGIVTLPLYGKIAAGTPIAALRDQSRTIDVSQDLLSRKDHYALVVEGDSMIEAGIFDGDTVIIERTDNADNGTIVVALVDNEEVTLKRLRRRGNSIALEPANPKYEPRICGPEQVKVQGRLVALIRTY
ncbi:MAG: transcriptional repressor LexA [Rhodospirillales bacterium]